jgi:hypothetical protein
MVRAKSHPKTRLSWVSFCHALGRANHNSSDIRQLHRSALHAVGSHRKSRELLNLNVGRPSPTGP